ncbi:MAG: hypothetical protein R3174_00535 [Gammaproteobacteria bacterium]|nr:hypothetical protein [Gammaproteobacteria bacterium]
MGKESDRIASDIACLRSADMPFTLVSTAGFHCEVWRSMGVIVREGGRTALDFVLKVCKRAYRLPELKVLVEEHRTIHAELEEMVPQAQFIATEVNRKPGVIVMVENCTPWFDLSNPGNEDEALPLLRRQPRARAQLGRFTACVRRWLDEESRIIDLCGTENLVLDRNYQVRYLDSFHVFFYLDTLHVIDEVDDALQFRVETSINRLEYLERLVEALDRGRHAAFGAFPGRRG